MNYDNEATQLDNAANEETILDNEKGNTTDAQEQENAASDEVEVKSAKKDWKNTAIGAGAGVLVGGLSTFLMGMKADDSNNGHGGGNNSNTLSHPEWVDGEVKVATSVNDDMSFNEAFAAARAEVGPGGCFEWHGQVYGTYTADEWNHMTPEQKAEFGDHFSWNHFDHSNSDVAHHSSTPSEEHHVQPAPAADDDVDVVSVDHPDQPDQPVTQVSADEPDVEILGVVHDPEAGVNVGAMSVGGEQVVLIDVDNDLTFDFMGADANHNGQLDEGEVTDISSQNITVNDLGGFTNPTPNVVVDDDPIDYTADTYDC